MIYVKTFASIPVIHAAIDRVRNEPTIKEVGGVLHWSHVIIKKMGERNRKWWDCER